jgi:hypothetical protein
VLLPSVAALPLDCSLTYSCMWPAVYCSLVLLLLHLLPCLSTAGSPMHIDAHLPHELVVLFVAVGMVNRNLACATTLDLTLWQ